MEYPQYDGLTLRELAVLMKQLEAEHETLKARTTAKWREFEHVADRLIPDKMDEMEVTKITYEGLGTISLYEQIHASVPKENKEDLYGWLEAHGYGDLLTETVNSSTLSAQVRQWIKNAESYPDDLINLNVMRRAKVK